MDEGRVERRRREKERRRRKRKRWSGKTKQQEEADASFLDCYFTFSPAPVVVYFNTWCLLTVSSFQSMSEVVALVVAQSALPAVLSDQCQ